MKGVRPIGKRDLKTLGNKRPKRSETRETQRRL